MTRWQLEGSAAQAYERHLVPAFFGPFAERLIELAQPRPGDRMAARRRRGAPAARCLLRPRRLPAGSAGFEDVSVRIRIAPVRFPSARDLLVWQQAASPLAGPLSALAEPTHEALVRDFAAALEPYTDDDGVCFPMQTHVLTAAC